MLTPTFSWPTRTELREMLAVAAPVVIVQVGLQVMGFVDTLMVGRLSADALAGVALGNFYFFNVAIFGMGTLMALDPVVAQAFGAGDLGGARRGIQRGVLLALLISVLVGAAFAFSGSAFQLLRQPPAVVPMARHYVEISAVGLPAFFLFVVLRQALQAMLVVRPVLVAVVVANLVNVFANWVLIFGNLGAPPMGVAGSAWATVLARWVMGATLLVAGWPTLRPHLTGSWRAATAFGPLWATVRLGAPIGFQWFFEAGAFAMATLMFGWLGTVPLAAHEVALSLASLTFMVPVGFSVAAAALVGQAVGRSDMPSARRHAAGAWVLGVGFMAFSGMLMLAFPSAIARWFTLDAAVVAAAAPLIAIAGVFQVFDGTQAVASGLARGTGDTKVPMFLHLFGFWALGVPLAAVLGFRTPLGGAGIWWGLTLGLIVAAVLQAGRVRRRLRRDIARTVVEHPAAQTP
ncbi:MAG: MATE family efflux transporter [Gemmatimonadetes bacterium]|nr:MATE family efflux transporter [Gemmatimonadota bacterium]